MTYKDFFHAMTPFHYQKSHDMSGYFRAFSDEIQKVMTVADVDKNGTISFTEFFYFVLICQTSYAVIQRDFARCKGKMTIEQFSENLNAHRRKT